MKNYKALILFLLIFLFNQNSLLFSQNNSGKIEYTATLDLDKESMLEPNVYSTTLYFTKNESVTLNDGESLSRESEDRMNSFIDLSDNNKDPMYKNYNTREIISNEFVLDKLFRVYDTIPSINWKLFTDKKQIGEMTCLKATGYFRGRNYTAWYAPQIPISYGPWKFSDLPGLIVEVADSANEVNFKLTKLSWGLTKKELKIIHPPNKGKKIEFDEYFELWDKKAVDLIDYFSSKLGSDNVSIGGGDEVYRIEKTK